MKKYRKIILLALLAVIVVCGLSFGIYKALVDENSLSIKEKKWINANSSTVIPIAVPNDLPVFGSTGTGVFFDFVEYLEKNTGLDLNINTVSYLSKEEDYHFEITPEFDPDGLLIYKDHYVLVSKTTGIINDSSIIKTLKPAVLKSSMKVVKDYFDIKDEDIEEYESYTKISEDLGNGKITYALVPLNEFKDILTINGINILSHISDLNKYYYFRLGDNNMINRIFTKKYNSFMKSQYRTSYDKNNYRMFINNLKITEAEEDELISKVYRYGFAENRPYEILASGEYGGIISEYLKSFSRFSGVEFTYRKYKNPTEVAKNAIKGNIDLYYNYYDLITNYIDCGELHKINYYVIANNSIDLSMSNINGLNHRTVYVLKNSYLYEEIKKLEGINVITYEKNSDLKKIIKKDSILVVDEYTYDYYINNLTNDYSVRYKGTIEDENYSFRYSNDTDTFFMLFNAYTKTLDPQDFVRFGVTSYNYVEHKGKVIGSIAVGILTVVIVGAVSLLIYNKNRKKIKLDTKVKKEDRLKYIDLLTSLKNRNYYNEKLKVWNKNTIYPQACVVMDINNVKELNDTYGHEEGDKLIQSVANILIKTQIDNTEIIRTDGNEFLVYMVGYSEKQILNYMKKLIKEFNKLPHNKGVAMGFSIIDDDTKLIEDAFNEASIKMRENKEINEGSDDKKN